MGRIRTKKNIAVKAVNDINSQQQAPATKQPSPSSLLDKAQSLIIQCDYGLAQRFIRRVLDQQPTNAQAKEMLGVVLLETGEIAAAKEAFLSLLPTNPGAPSPPPSSAHLYLAQLSGDNPRLALQHYQAAIDILSVQLKGIDRTKEGEEKSDDVELKNSIVGALIGQVEIWMDPSYDLCFEPEAEKTCEDLISLALQTDPGNSEALQVLASVRMSQQRPDDAKECLREAWSAWKDLEPDDARIPPIPTRLGLVKLFLELYSFTPALLVLQGIMSLDDQEVEAWYLEGWCFFMMSEQARENDGKLDGVTWEELAKDARDCLETCQVLHKNEEHPDTPLLEHVAELLTQLDGLGIVASPLEEGDDYEGEWDGSERSEDSDGDVAME